jgi:hypothetical protein
VSKNIFQRVEQAIQFGLPHHIAGLDTLFQTRQVSFQGADLLSLQFWRAVVTFNI